MLIYFLDHSIKRHRVSYKCAKKKLGNKMISKTLSFSLSLTWETKLLQFFFEFLVGNVFRFNAADDSGFGSAFNHIVRMTYRKIMRILRGKKKGLIILQSTR